MLQHLVFEFSSEKELREVQSKMWDHHAISGEMAARPLPGGRWRLELWAEKDVRENILEKFAAYRVEAGD